MNIPRLAATLATAALLATGAPQPAKAGTDVYLGEIIIVAFNFCPKNYMHLNGSVLPINANTALFSLLGINFGGNGTTNFLLPDLQGRHPVSQGSGPGLSTVLLGEKAGTPSTTLTTSQMPAHSHSVASVTGKVVGTSEAGHSAVATGRMMADDQHAATHGDVPAGASQAAMAAGTVKLSGSTDVAGSSLPFAIRQPYTGLRFCIASTGVYPSRP